jgi:hypothetical protein
LPVSLRGYPLKLQKKSWEGASYERKARTRLLRAP